MIRLKHLLIYAASILLLVSCSDYSAQEKAQINTISRQYDFNPPPMRLHDYGYSDTYPGVVSSYRQYNFVIGSDIEQFYKASVALRMAILNDFYSQLNVQGFNPQDIYKEYHSFLSPHIKSAAKDDWQMFKPQTANAKCLIAYEGDDWFSVKYMESDAEVRLRVVLTGKNLQPVVAEVDNPSLGIKTGMGDNSDLGSGYVYKKEWDYGIFNNKKRNSEFKTYVANIIYRHCNGGDKSRSFITETELLAFADRIVQKRERLLKEFYADLTSSDFTKQSFSEKYDKMITGAVAFAMESASGKAAKTNPYGRWAPFEPKDKTSYTLAYDEQDWFTVSDNKADKPDVYLQAVFYGKEMRPLIVGLYNEALNINVQQEFYTNRNSRTFGWELRKHW